MKARSSGRPSSGDATAKPTGLWETPRTFAIVGHRSAGKTSLGELLLQAARVTRSVGSVSDGTSLLDWSDEERRHRQTLGLSVVWMEHGGRPLQLIDAPGAEFLAHERDRAIHVSDAVVLAIDAAEGVRIGTEDALDAAMGAGVAAVAVLTKVDRADAAPIETIADALQARIPQGPRSPRVVPLHLPVLEGGVLVGLVDVLTNQLLRFSDQELGTFSPEPVPEALRARVSVALERVAEAVALTDDELLERYLEDLELPLEEVRHGLGRAVAMRTLIPLLATSALRRVGADALLDALAAWLPEPGAAQVRDHDGRLRPVCDDDGFVAEALAVQRDKDGNVFTLLRVWSGEAPRTGAWVEGRSGRTVRIRKLYRVRGPRRSTAPRAGPGALVATWDPIAVRPGDTLTDGGRFEVVGPPPPVAMMDLWVRPRDDRDAARVQEALQEVVRADAGLALHTDAVSGAVLLAGRSEAHLRLSVERIESWAGCRVETALPPVGYREVPAGRVEGVEGTHVREGDHGLVSEYGRCEVALAPTGPELDTRFVDDIGAAGEEDLPQRYRPAIDEGAREALRHGPTAGYPVVGVEMRLTGGDYDILQSTDEHFRMAGEKATRMALQRTGTRILEPWWEVNVKVPQTTLGDLISDISSHRGRIVGMVVEGDEAQLVAHCPYRELRTFASRLQGLTGGRGHFQSRESHYEPLPSHLLSEAIESSPFRR